MNRRGRASPLSLWSRCVLRAGWTIMMGTNRASIHTHTHKVRHRADNSSPRVHCALLYICVYGTCSLFRLFTPASSSSSVIPIHNHKRRRCIPFFGRRVRAVSFPYYIASRVFSKGNLFGSKEDGPSFIRQQKLSSDL